MEYRILFNWYVCEPDDTLKVVLEDAEKIGMDFENRILDYRQILTISMTFDLLSPDIKNFARHNKHQSKG
jgi:hypothetical protein